jgi:hypothetical protein
MLVAAWFHSRSWFTEHPAFVLNIAFLSPFGAAALTPLGVAIL